MPRLIDIHTHRWLSEADVFCVANLLPEDSPPENQSFSAGIHPWRLNKSALERQYEWLDELIVHPELVAIGECGIDLLYPDPDLQTKVFEWQVERAQRHNLPLIIHAVRSHDRVISIKRQYGIQNTSSWIIHGFALRPSIARPYLDHGFYLSFGAALLRQAPSILESFRLCPDDRIFLETDDALINIRQLYAKAAELRGIKPAQMISLIQRNFAACFRKLPQ